jgi:hypothetical protein
MLFSDVIFFSPTGRRDGESVEEARASRLDRGLARAVAVLRPRRQPRRQGKEASASSTAQNFQPVLILGSLGPLG